MSIPERALTWSFRQRCTPGRWSKRRWRCVAVMVTVAVFTVDCPERLPLLWTAARGRDRLHRVGKGLW